jgi:hypothetical protein
MSPENVETRRAVVEAFNRPDGTQFGALLPRTLGVAETACQ